jgi:hypothetical protein
VTNTDDDGPGSLRQALLDTPDGGVIQFDPSIAGQVIALSTGRLIINKSVSIEGPVPAGMTISGSAISGVFGVATGLAVFRNLSIVNGRSTTNGGGIGLGGDAILDHVLVANNEAIGDGGGIATLATARLTLINSTVSGNSAAIGGGIGGSGVITIRNSTIARNSAWAEVGGIYAYDLAVVSVRNSIIGDNIKGTFGGADCGMAPSATISGVGTNLASDDSCGAAFLVGDPRLAPLASNGGPTRTHELLSDSPAVDAGTLCTEDTDQRYVARPQGASCDLGAFEFDAYRAISLTISPNVAVNTKTGIATVTGTLSCLGPAPTPLRVSLSQTQKTTGKFTTIIQAQVNIPATCTSAPSSWSVTLAPTTGKFEHGVATGSASVLSAPVGYLPVTVDASLKLFQVK